MNSSIPHIKKDHVLSRNSSCSFIITIYLDVQNLKILDLIDSKAYFFFIDIEILRIYKMHIVKKAKAVHVKVTNGKFLSFKYIIHKTNLLQIA